jgi:hypothetical protein
MPVYFDASTSAGIGDIFAFIWLFSGFIVFSIGISIALALFRR